jgi:gluconolactonase
LRQPATKNKAQTLLRRIILHCNLSATMKIHLPGLAILAALILPTHAESLIAPDAKVQKLAGDFKFTEGPTCDKAGNLFFVDQPNNRIMEWSVDGKLSTFMQPSGYSNGMMFDANGNLITCADERNQLWSIAPNKSVTVLVTNYQGKVMNGPNDVWVAPNGAMFLTDPFYKRTWWDHTNQLQDARAVYRFSPDHKELTRAAEGFVMPNGITGTPDGKTLYVADINADKLYRYDILPDGALTNRILICNHGSDGMTIDEEGNLYMTPHGQYNGVTVVDKSGKDIERIDVPEHPANVCFGGKDRKTLFITARTGLYSVQMRVKGANAAK